MGIKLMHHKLSTFLIGMRQEQPDFSWYPTDLHNRLASVLPAHAVYGLFRDAWLSEDILFVDDQDGLGRAQRFLPEIQRVLNVSRIERVFK